VSTVTVVPTVENSTGPDDPPRIKLDVTDVGTSPSIFSTTVLRKNSDGSLVPVRTANGNPLVLTTSGSNRIGLVYDYEMPLGQVVQYTTEESPATISAGVTVTELNMWLIHVGLPALSRRIELRKGSLEEEEWPVEQGIHQAQGRKNPIVVTDGIRKGNRSAMTLSLASLTELQAVRDLFADAGTLLFNVPESTGLGITSAYIAAGNVKNKRLSDIGTDPYRDIEFPYIEVDRPAGGSQAERTLADLMVFPTLASVKVAHPTLANVLAGT
jgi:hypothetical protein